MTALGGAAMALAVSVSLAAPAVGRSRPSPAGLSSGSDRIVISGTCDAGSRWTLSGRSRYLRVDVEARVDAVRPKQRARWVLRLSQNQNTVAVRARRMSGGGTVKVKARVGNLPGTDTFTLNAINRATGETCQGTLTF